MDIRTTDDAVTRRIQFFTEREKKLRENDLYFYNQPVEEIKGWLTGDGERARNGDVRLLQLSWADRSPAHQRGSQGCHR